MTELAKTLRLSHYFSLAFGTMIGVGWLVVMDDWLTRGGPGGGLIAFAIGGIALLPVAAVYGRLVALMPDAAGEAAYTARAFSTNASYAVGWTMLLTYLIVCPWEAVAIGRIAGYLFPALNSQQLYQLAGSPVYLPTLLLGLAITGLFTWINFRGVTLSATFQNWTTFGTLGLIGVTVLVGIPHGSVENFRPAFNGSPLLSVILMLQIVPYFLTGFESVSKSSEEATPGLNPNRFVWAMVLAIVVGVAFYAAILASVGFIAPWQTLVHEKFATAVAFERAVGAGWVVNLVMAAALLSLLKILNGNFIAASRLLFALARRGLVRPSLAAVHPINRTPAAAILGVGAATAAAVFLGPAILVPVTEVAAVTVAIGWMSACCSYLRIDPRGPRTIAAWLGIVVTGVMVLMKVLPMIPGHFSAAEWIALGLWCLAGLILRNRLVDPKG